MAASSAPRSEPSQVRISKSGPSASTVAGLSSSAMSTTGLLTAVGPRRSGRVGWARIGAGRAARSARRCAVPRLPAAIAAPGAVHPESRTAGRRPAYHQGRRDSPGLPRPRPNGLLRHDPKGLIRPTFAHGCLGNPQPVHDLPYCQGHTSTGSPQLTPRNARRSSPDAVPFHSCPRARAGTRHCSAYRASPPDWRSGQREREGQHGEHPDDDVPPADHRGGVR